MDGMLKYPILIGQMASRGIKKSTVASAIDCSNRTLNNKLSGKTPFTWGEVICIRDKFFPDVEIEHLMQTHQGSQNG